MTPAILAIDLGSSTVKAAVVDHGGVLLGTGAHPIDLTLGGEGARATSDGVDVAALRKQLIAALERNLEQPAVVE